MDNYGGNVMFKKFVVFALIAILVLSLCACNSSNETIVVEGEEVVLHNGESVTIASGEFVITKLDAVHRYSPSGSHYKYLVTVENDNHCITFEASVGHYSLWNIGDIVEGSLTKVKGCNETFEVDGETYYPLWHGEKTTG